MGSKKNERKRAFQMAYYVRRYWYQLVWYRYHNGNASNSSLGTGTN